MSNANLPKNIKEYVVNNVIKHMKESEEELNKYKRIFGINEWCKLCNKSFEIVNMTHCRICRLMTCMICSRKRFKVCDKCNVLHCGFCGTSPGNKCKTRIYYKTILK